MTANSSLARSLPPLHHLQAFESVARNRSIAKAAGELHVSRTTLEQQLQALEGRLGIKLVRAMTPAVTLTDAGQQYLKSVQNFTQHLRDELYVTFPSGRSQLRVTASQAIARLWLAPRIGDFVRRHPRIDLIITSTDRTEALKDGGVDVGLRYDGRNNDGLFALPLWEDRHIAAAAPQVAERAAGKEPTELPRFVPLIDHTVTSWRQWLAAIDPTLAPIRPYLRCTDLHLAIEAAEQGMGVVIAPSRMLSGKLASGQLQRITDHSTAGLTYKAVVSHEQQFRTPVIVFLKWLAEQVAEYSNYDSNPP